jgi:hypothetical protein
MQGAPQASIDAVRLRKNEFEPCLLSKKQKVKLIRSAQSRRRVKEGCLESGLGRTQMRTPLGAVHRW